MPPDIKITTELLYQGTLVFALADAVFVSLLVWRMKEETFRRLKWPLSIVAALVWLGIWSWAIGNFWGTVYSYVFPAWARTWIPWFAFTTAGIVTLALWQLTARIRWNAILTFCLMGGLIGSLTHIWAVFRGIVTKPPILQGASPLGAVVIAFFEYIFYWCVILTLAGVMNWAWNGVKTMSMGGTRAE